MSPQEEETLALAAIARLGEASAHDIATELGVPTIRNTLGRLVDSRRVEKRRLVRAQGDVWVYLMPAEHLRRIRSAWPFEPAKKVSA